MMYKRKEGNSRAAVPDFGRGCVDKQVLCMIVGIEALTQEPLTRQLSRVIGKIRESIFSHQFLF